MSHGAAHACKIQETTPNEPQPHPMAPPLQPATKHASSPESDETCKYLGDISSKLRACSTRLRQMLEELS